MACMKYQFSSELTGGELQHTEIGFQNQTRYAMHGQKYGNLREMEVKTIEWTLNNIERMLHKCSIDHASW